MKKLYFMRHVLSEMNKAGLRCGSIESPLTVEGRADATKAGQKAINLGIDIIVSSSMGRAVETAQLVAQEIGYPLETIQITDLLIERNFGELEGTPYFPDMDKSGIKDVESLEMLFERARMAYEWIQTLPGDTILVVSHGSIGRALRHIINPDIPFQGAGHFTNAEIVQLV